MSRRNEIKKDLWKILRDVYNIPEFREITDKQNDFLNRAVRYLEENISLRRKTDKAKQAEPEDNEPLAKPEAAPMPDFSKLGKRRRRKEPDPPKEETSSVKEKQDKIVKATNKAAINISALPEHLRKYV